MYVCSYMNIWNVNRFECVSAKLFSYFYVRNNRYVCIYRHPCTYAILLFM